MVTRGDSSRSYDRLIYRPRTIDRSRFHCERFGGTVLPTVRTSVPIGEMMLFKDDRADLMRQV